MQTDPAPPGSNFLSKEQGSGACQCSDSTLSRSAGFYVRTSLLHNEEEAHSSMRVQSQAHQQQ